MFQISFNNQGFHNRASSAITDPLFQINLHEGHFNLIDNGNLRIAAVNRNDAGDYDCEAFNGIGESVQRRITLRVLSNR
jgi:hypothetical protein